MKKRIKLFQYKKLFVIPVLIILQLMPLHGWVYAEAVAAVVTGADTEAGVDAKADKEATTGAGTKADIDAAAGVDAETDTDATTGAGTKADADAAGVDAKTDTDAAGANTKADTDAAAADAKTDIDATAGADTKADTDATTGADTKADTDATTGADTKADTDAAGADANTDAEATEADANTDTEAVGVEEDEAAGAFANSYADHIKQQPDLNSPSCGVNIDGYFDDWENKPMSTLSWNSNNGNAHHDVAFIKDSDSIYIYVNLHPMYHSTIPLDNIYLSVNNNERTLFLGNAYAQTMYLKKNGTYLDLHPFIYGSNIPLGNAAVTLAKGNQTDQMEIQISISALEYAMGLKPGTINSGAQLELRMPQLGRESILLFGTSTGAIPGVLLCIGIVMAVRLYRSRKVRKIG